MKLRQICKFLFYSRVPGVSGGFPYFGTRVYFPRNSTLFRTTCESGVFEMENVEVMKRLITADTTILDVGANIGLMAIPLLSCSSSISVISFECSPNSLPYLRRTVADSAFASRWSLIEKAAGASVGRAEFSIGAEEHGAGDGLKSTGRRPEVSKVEVAVTTIDVEWKSAGMPPVSLIKIDVEGGELSVLKGAVECLQTCRPALLIEWQPLNLSAHHVAPEELLTLALQVGYDLFAMPSLTPIQTATQLRAHTLLNEAFVLLPNGDASRPIKL